MSTGKVQFRVLADGGEDEGGVGVATIEVNGVDYCTKKPGHNVVVLDPTGEVVVAKNFNTNAGQGKAMAQFLDEIPEEHVVLIATQGVNGKEQGEKELDTTARPGLLVGRDWDDAEGLGRVRKR